MTVHEYIIPHVLIFRQHNGDDPPQENTFDCCNPCFLSLNTSGLIPLRLGYNRQEIRFILTAYTYENISLSCLLNVKLLSTMFFNKIFRQILARKCATLLSCNNTIDCLMILFATRKRDDSQLAETYRIQHVFPFPEVIFNISTLYFLSVSINNRNMSNMK